MKLIEHVSAFTVYPNDGIRIDPHMIRRVTSYDGALLEEAHPEVHDVLAPETARTMTAMLIEVVQFGTAIKAKSIGRPAGGKTGTTQDFTDAWFIGFTAQITAGVWVGFDDKQISLGKRETGAQAALPIWMEFIERGIGNMPAVEFADVVPLEVQAEEHHVHTDVPDTAPEDEAPAIRKTPEPIPPTSSPVPPPSTSTSTTTTQQ
jgi:penicillin-binding protein 1A